MSTNDVPLFITVLKERLMIMEAHVANSSAMKFSSEKGGDYVSSWTPERRSCPMPMERGQRLSQLRTTCSIDSQGGLFEAISTPFY